MDLSWNVVRGLLAVGGGGTPSSGRRRPRQLELACESLEGRVVPSHGGLRGAALRAAAAQGARASQVGSLATQGGTTLAARGGIRAARAGSSGAVTGATQDAQLSADLAKLRTDVNAVHAGSAATDALRLALSNDLRSIRDAGFTVNRTALATVADNVLTAIASNTDPGVYQADFSAAFTGGTDSSGTLLATAFTDFVAVARALNVDTTELSTLAADRSAIVADYARLGIMGRDAGSNLDLILAGPGGHGGRCG